MNVPKTTETAFADALTNFAIGEKTVIRCWHNLEKDQKWSLEYDRVFPCIDLRAWIKPYPNLSSAMMCEIQAIAYTKVADDQSHFVLNGIEQAIQECIDTLYAGHRGNDTTGLYASFTSAIEADCSINIGGIQLGEPLPPDEDGEGRNYVGLTLIVSYSRNDFN